MKARWNINIPIVTSDSVPDDTIRLVRIDAPGYRVDLVSVDEHSHPCRMWHAEGKSVVVSSVWRTNEFPGQIVLIGMDAAGMRAARDALRAAGFGVAFWPEEEE